MRLSSCFGSAAGALAPGPARLRGGDPKPEVARRDLDRRPRRNRAGIPGMDRRKPTGARRRLGGHPARLRGTREETVMADRLKDKTAIVFGAERRRETVSSKHCRDTPPRFEGMPSRDGHQFDPCIPHHAVPTNRGGFRVDRNPRNSGGLVRRSVVCEPNSDC